MAESYFRSKNWPYEEMDVSQNAANREEMIKLSGQLGVPVIVINGKSIIGFDRKAIDKAVASITPSSK